MGPIAWKLLGTGGALLAGLIATKVIDAIWARTVDDDINPKSPNAPLAKAVAYAAITGLAVGGGAAAGSLLNADLPPALGLVCTLLGAALTGALVLASASPVRRDVTALATMGREAVRRRSSS